MKPFWGNLLIVIKTILFIFLLTLVIENIYNKLRGGETTLEAIISTTVVLMIIAFIYPTEQAKKPNYRKLRDKYIAIVFSFMIFLAGSYSGSLFFKFQKTNYDVLKPEEKFQLFVDLILVLLTFTALVWYLLHREIENEMKNNIEKIKEQNKLFTETQALKNAGYMHYNLFKTSLNCNKEGRKKDITNNLGQAIEATYEALSLSKNLDEEKNKKLICAIKNNLAWFIKEKWECKIDNKERKVLKRLLNEEKTNKKYEGDKEDALDCIKYIKNEKGNFQYTKKEIDEMTETYNKVEKIFSQIDDLIK